MRKFFSASLLAAAALFASPPPALAQTNAAFAIYDPDPNHLWNRLFAAFYRQTYNVPTNSFEPVHWAGPDVLDPPVSLHPRFMLDDVPFAKCNAVLDEFLDRQGANLIRDPLKRAVLQRDLWAVLDVLNRTRFASPFAFPVGDDRTSVEVRRATGTSTLTASQEQHRLFLLGKLARAIRSLALTSSEIEALPDTYRAAVDSKVFPTAPDFAREAVLPDDLFATNTDWKEVIPPAPGRLLHVSMVSARSVFRAFVKLPQGKKMESKGSQRIGTQFLLLREMVCVSTNWQMAPTHVVESVQFRTSYRRGLSSQMSSEELQLNRALLFAGRQGGLRPVAGDELVPVLYNGLGHLAVDERGNAGYLTRFSMFCAGCHQKDGRELRSRVEKLSEPKRTTGIEPLVDWRRKYSPLEGLQAFILSPARGR